MDEHANVLRTNFVKKVAILLMVLSTLGLFICFAVPWYTFNIEDEKDSYRFDEMEDKLEEDLLSNDFVNYLTDSAKQVIMGYISVLLLGILLFIEYKKGSVSNFLCKRLPWLHQGTVSSDFAVLVLISLLTVIPVSLIIRGGMRVVGFSRMMEITGNSAMGDNEDGIVFSIGSPAGIIVTVISLILLAIVLFLIFTKLQHIVSDGELNVGRDKYLRSNQKMLAVILAITLAGMAVFPALAVLKLEIDSSYFDFSSYENDGSVSIIGNAMSGGEEDEIYESMGAHLSMVNHLFMLTVIICVLALLGILLYRCGWHERPSHFLISSGIFVTLFGVFMLFFFILYVLNVGKLNSILNSDDSYYGRFDIGVQASIGYNYIPVIIGFAILLVGILYYKSVCSVSLAVAMGRTAHRGHETSSVEPPTDHQSGVYYPHAGFSTSKFSKMTVLMVVVVATIMILAVGVSFMRNREVEKQSKTSEGFDLSTLSKGVSTESQSGYLEEGTEEYFIPIIEDGWLVNEVSVTLTWQDEPDANIRYRNTPDTFEVLVDSTEQTQSSGEVSDEDGNGVIEMTVHYDPPLGYDPEDDMVWFNRVFITVTCVEAGDHESMIGLLQFIDSGNDYTLDIEVGYLDTEST